MIGCGIEMVKNRMALKLIRKKFIKNKVVRKIYYKFFYKILVNVGIREQITIDDDRLMYDEEDIIQNCQYEIKCSLKDMKDCVGQSEDNILVAGEILKGKGLGYFSNKLNHLIDATDFYYLAESEMRDQIDFPVFVVPQMFLRNSYKKGEKLNISKNINEVIGSKEYLKWAVNNTKGRYSDMEEGYAENFVYYSYYYLNKVLDIIKPKAVVLWLEFYAFHEIFLNICNERGIKVLFFEFGVLPGTYAFETTGQMGESLPAINYAEFFDLKVDEDDIIHAQNVIKYLYENRVTRWQQPMNDVGEIDILKEKLIIGKPVILYAGQNDYESGIRPYGEYARKYHSPVFESSDQAAVYLGKLAAKNNWNIIYKPHPAVLRFACRQKEYDIPDNVIIVDRIDINDLIDMADVLVTIVSQMGYMSLIRGKSAVMLGYTQLRGKSCTYEAFSQSVIEKVINDAIQFGVTEEQKANFTRHVAQIIKFYVFDDGEEREIRYGKDMVQCMELMKV